MIKFSDIQNVRAIVQARLSFDDGYETKDLLDSMSAFLEEMERLDSITYGMYSKGYDMPNFVEIVPTFGNARNAGRKKKNLDEDPVYRLFCKDLSSGMSIRDVAKNCGISNSTAFRWKKRMLEG